MEAPGEQARGGGSGLGDLQATGDLAVGVGEGLTVFAGDESGELAPPLFGQTAEAVQDAGALQGRGGTPGGLRAAGSGNRVLHRSAGGRRVGGYLCNDRPPGRIHDIAKRGLRGEAPSGYEVVDAFHEPGGGG